MIVVDTNILVYLLLSTEHTPRARALLEFAYDARFLVVAEGLGIRLVTEDVKLRRAAPKLTQSLAQALGGA